MIDIATWKELSTQLKIIKQQEGDMRRAICAELEPMPDLEKGRHTHKEHIDGFLVKAVYTLNYSIDKAALAAVWNELSELERASIRLVPELKLKEYKALPKGSLLHEAVVTKNAMPTLEATEKQE